jgi:hypothetical protein
MRVLKEFFAEQAVSWSSKKLTSHIYIWNPLKQTR